MGNCDDLNLTEIKLETEELIIKDEFAEDFTIKEEDHNEEQDPLIISKYNEEIPIDYCNNLNLSELDEIKREQDACLVSKSDSDPSTYRIEDTSNDTIEVCVIEVENNQLTKVDRFLNSEPSAKSNAEPKTQELLKCYICGRTFVQNSLFKKHMQWHQNAKHDERNLKVNHQSQKRVPALDATRPFVCLICKKCFIQKIHLKVHMRIYEGKKPFKCHLCDKAFTFSSSMKAHMPVHTGERPFKCDACEKCFSRYDNLKKHSATHSGQKPFCCDTCGKGYTKKSYLEKHVVEKHKFEK